MPRPERIISEGNPVAELALELRQLRAFAGNPSYRALAARANFSFSTLAKAANGRDLPTLEVALAFAATCGGDLGNIRARWEIAQRSLNREATKNITSPRPDSRLAVPYAQPVPQRATTTRVFIETMRQLQHWAGFTLRELERRSPGTLSRSTVSDALKRDSLPRLELVEAFVIACGGRRDLPLWRDRWRELNRQEARAAVRRRRSRPSQAVKHAIQVKYADDMDIDLVVSLNNEWSRLPEGTDVEAIKADLIRSLNARYSGDDGTTGTNTQDADTPAPDPPPEQNAGLERELRYTRALAALATAPVRGGSDCL